MLSYIDTSRQDTTLAKGIYVEQVSITMQPGKRSWVHSALALRVVENDRDVTLVNDIWMRRHYLGGRPSKPKAKRLSYLGDLKGIYDPGSAGAAVAVTIALQPSASTPIKVLRTEYGIHPCSILELVRCWRADDLGPSVAPDLTPYTLRRIIKGGNGVLPLKTEWEARKLSGGLEAPAKVLITYADPSLGHDGGLYRGAGAIEFGKTANGKLAFVWPLEQGLVINSITQEIGQ